MSKWLEELLRSLKAGVAHTFLLHLNIFDYVPVQVNGGIEYLSMREYMAKHLFAQKKLVVFYDRSSSLTFGGTTPEETAAMELLFRKVTGTNTHQFDVWPRDPSVILPIIERLLTCSKAEQKDKAGEEIPDGEIVVVVDFAETIVPSGQITGMPDSDRTNIVTLTRWTQHPVISQRKSLLFLLASNLDEIASQVRSVTADVVAVKIPLPNEKARLEYLGYLATKYPTFKYAAGVTPQMVAHIASGLPLKVIEDMIRLSVVDGKPLDISFVYEKKKETIESLSGGLLRVVRPTWTFDDIGGLREAKKELAQIADAFSKGEIMEIPEGVMLMGPPGTAKSVLAEAFAGLAGVPMVDLVTVRNMWVGSSEQRLEHALRIIDELAPVIVRRDEAEAEDKRRGATADNDTGVNARLQARQFEFFADPRRRGRVLLFRITNRPDLMDPAAIRAGRSDLRIPILPCEDDVPDIIDRLMRVLTNQSLAMGQEISWAVTGTEIVAACKDKFGRYTGADIRAMLAIAARNALRRASRVVEETDVVATVEDYLPSRNEEEYMFMSALALHFTSMQHLIPSEWRKKIVENATSEILTAAREAYSKTKAGVPQA